MADDKFVILLEPHSENRFPEGEDSDGRHEWYERGQAIARAVGYEQLEEILRRN